VLLDYVLSLVLSLMALLVGPRFARCPAGYVTGGIERDGWFVCMHELIGDEYIGWRPPGGITSRLYCARGEIPMVFGDHAFACGRGMEQR